MNLLNFEDMYLLQCGKFAYSIINSDCPPNIKERFSFANESHDYGLRSRTNDPLRLSEPRVVRKHHEAYLSNNLPRIWNKIPDDVRRSITLSSFKNILVIP